MGKREPNFIYIRRIATEHDLTHEINIGKPALNIFFEGNLHLTFHHINNYEKKYAIDINSFNDDPRFGKEVYNLINDEGGIEIGDLFIVYKQSKQDYLAEVVKTGNSKFDFFNQLYTKPDSNERHSFIITEDGENANFSYTPNFSQKIYYGVPGSGKSNEINNTLKKEIDNDKDREFQTCRVVFHPEYTNADFVGQVLPRVKGGDVKYEFKPGPFAKILYRALHNPEKKFFLVIEEINRGNAAAIFGDIFQLLDRITSENDKETIGNNTFGIGWSKYFIENDYINNYIRSKVEYSVDSYTEEHDNKPIPLGENIVFSTNTSLRLPPNLSLLATMNTSDQNVFTLDNAFQRRWEMELVPNVVDKTVKDEKGIAHGKLQMEAKIEGTEITWEDFQKQINNIIGEKSNESGLSSMEDKRLGCWFVKAENGVISKDTFANKVLKYLWDDAFKFYHQEIFGAEIKNFEELQKAFFEKGFDVFSESCGLQYSDNSHAELDSASNEGDSETSSE
ncbi:AAA family ATPase [Treponema sp.]|uniref:AAA family ATPase n=1 Tax=Treponema sp. TaxID=166 RepID=UPI003F01E2EC